MNDCEQFSQHLAKVTTGSFAVSGKKGKLFSLPVVLSFLHFIFIFLLLLQDRCFFAADGLVEEPRLSYQATLPFLQLVKHANSQIMC